MKTEVRNVTRVFGKMKAVDNLSFTFEDGNIFGFIGPNGAGKTTTIRIMATIDTATSGDVLYDGVSASIYPDAIRRVIGYMPDSLPSYKDITVLEYLDFFARSFGLKGAKRTTTLNDLVEFTNLGEIQNKLICELSKGMKQRVSLARALVHNPKVLIMDEPAAGLDPRARYELRILLKILAEQKKAILLSSHILTELQDICNGAVIIERGKLLSAGTTDEILAQVENEEMQPANSGAVPRAPIVPVMHKAPPVMSKAPPVMHVPVAGQPPVAPVVPQGQPPVAPVIPQGGQPVSLAVPPAGQQPATPAGEQPEKPARNEHLSNIVIRTPSGEAEPVRLKLLEHPLTRSAELVDDNEVHALIGGTPAEVSAAIGTVFAAGLTVISIEQNRMGLEELFMRITQNKSRGRWS